MADKRLLLIVNAGSSSIKLELFDAKSNAPAIVKHDASGEIDAQQEFCDFERKYDLKTDQIYAVVHRIVHGGGELYKPVRIDENVMQKLRKVSQLAPLHNPPALKWIHEAQCHFKNAIQIATFDTGFFHHLPQASRCYALPHEFIEKIPETELRRYGFHGFAHQDMCEHFQRMHPEIKSARIVTLQLGSGCSIAAIRCGEGPVDTSMGFGPLEGLVMATRIGDVDPALLLYIMRTLHLSVDEMEDKLYHKSGLLGLSGEKDMAKILSSQTDVSVLAVDKFVSQCVKYIGAYAARLGGLDGIIFGGGIGEHAHTVRSQILDHFHFLGVRFNRSVNLHAHSPFVQISTHESRFFVYVCRVDEGSAMARTASSVLDLA